MKYWFTDSNADLRALEGAPNLADKIKIVKDRMQVDAGVLDAVDVVSIPDVWNIHRIYEMMLLYGINDDDKVSQDYKQAVLKHWYAILAIHFLGAAKFGLKLNTSNITQATITTMPEMASTPEVTAKLLRTKQIMQAAWDARPITRISSSPGFDPNTIRVHYVVNAKGERLPYAMSSATTYLVPTADAWENLYSVCQNIPWIQPNPNDTSYQIQDPSMVPGALTLNERQELSKRLIGIVQTELDADHAMNLGAAAALSALIQAYSINPGGLLAPPTLPDIFPENLHMFYIKFSGCKAATTANDPNIGGMDDRCVCSRREDDGTFTNYLISIPLTEQAKEWMLNGAGNYAVQLIYQAGKVKFVCQYTYDGLPPFTKDFCDTAANLYEINQANMGVTALWPRYRMTNWGKYYVFHQPAQGALIGGGTTYSIEPETAVALERAFPADATTVRYQQLNKWPQTWILWAKNSAGNQSAAGYFLTRTIDVAPQIPGQIYRIAIDFGTSSTMLYGGIDGNQVGPIEGNHIWSLPIFAPNIGTSAAAIYRYFVPSTNTDTMLTPLQSILAIENENGAPVLTGNWTYFQQSAEAKSRQTLPNRFAIHSNLKWDPVNGALYTTSFLLLVAYYVALEARACGCSNLDTVISYPSAMTGWRNYIQGMDQQLGIACEIAKIGLVDHNEAADREIPWRNKTITESCAVAQKTCQNHQATQFCSIDIGGGTSDIFIFKNDGNPMNLAWDGYESSLLCGARAILLESFVADRNCLNALINLAPADPIMRALNAAVPQMQDWGNPGLTRETIQRNIEFLLSVKFMDAAHQWHNAGEELRQRAVSQQGLDNPSIAKLRKRVAYHTAAVLFYAGLMTRGTGTQVDQLHLRFAGNGSKTLQWISNDDENTKRFLSKMFNVGAGIEAEGMGQNPNNIQFAATPKHEVADGALKDPIEMGNHVDEILSGEIVRLYDGLHQDKFVEWPVGKNVASELFDDAKNFVPGNETLKTFVQAFRDATRGILLINLRADEFNPAVADAAGVRLTINRKVADIVAGRNPDKKSFFMIGVDALSDQYFR